MTHDEEELIDELMFNKITIEQFTERFHIRPTYLKAELKITYDEKNGENVERLYRQLHG